MKNIGILTYHSVCNFVRNLQSLSTVGYFKKNGYNPIVIDWVPDEVERQYINSIPPPQFAEHQRFVRDHLPLSGRCRSEEDILKQIHANALDAVVIGSDAVTQHKSLLSRLHFPTRRFFTVAPPPPSHLLYPNPFWGGFASKTNPRMPVIMMSVSSQNEQFLGIYGRIRKQMYKTLRELSYISVRDSWTQKMFMHISNGRLIPPITPDPASRSIKTPVSLLPPSKPCLTNSIFRQITFY